MGITVLLVEHDMKLVMQLAEWVVVLDHGRKLAEGTGEQIRKDRQVIAAYLGTEARLMLQVQKRSACTGATSRRCAR